MYPFKPVISRIVARLEGHEPPEFRKHELGNMEICIGKDLTAKVGYKTLSRISAAGAVPSEAA